MSLTLLSRSPRPQSTTPASPPAARTGRAWWRDGRVVGGILIVVVSVVLGARLMASGDDTVAVWQVNRDVAAGTVLSADDVTAVNVPPRQRRPTPPQADFPLIDCRAISAPVSSCPWSRSRSPPTSAG